MDGWLQKSTVRVSSKLTLPLLTQRRLSSLPLLKRAITDLECLLVMGKSAPKQPANAVSYNMNTYRSYENEKRTGLQKLYLFCFTLAKPE